VSFASDASVTAAGAVGIDGTQGTTFQNFSAAVVQVSSTTLPPTFIDNFSTTTFGSQLDSFWTNRFGNISVVGGQAKCTAAVNVSTVNGINAADVKVTGDLALTGTQAGGLVARFSGPLNDNYYFGQVAGNGGGGFVASIFKTVGGVTTMLATGTVTPTS